MFWKGAKGLAEVPVSSKVALTIFLLVAGVGYLLGFLNIYLSYSPVDQEPGMSVADIRMSFWGARDASKLEKSIDGSMRQYFASDADHATVKDWIAAGASREAYDADVAPIFATSCATCHSADARVADVVTVTFEGVEPLLAQDTGKSVPRLISLSHTHVLATLPVIFMLALIFSFTRFGETLKTLVMGFSAAAIVLDVGTWWLAKVSGALAVTVILGGITLALSFLMLILLSLYDMWIARPKSSS
jgi:hypothetical protein